MVKNVTTFRTDKDNSIWITSDGKSIEVKKLDYNIDGAGRKHASIFKKVFYNAFFFNFERHDIDHHSSIVAYHS